VEYALDRALLAELREIERAIAEELGQHVVKTDVALVGWSLSDVPNGGVASEERRPPRRKRLRRPLLAQPRRKKRFDKAKPCISLEEMNFRRPICQHNSLYVAHPDGPQVAQSGGTLS